MGLIDSVKSVREIKYASPEGSHSASGNLISSDRFITFNPAGHITEILIYEKGRLFSTLRYDYNELSQKIGYQEFDSKDRLYISVSYTYDESGDLVRENYDRSLQKLYDDRRKEIDVEYYKYYQNLFTSVVYKHNLKGYVISKEYFKPDSSLAFRYEYSYDYKGFLVKTFYYNDEGKLTWYEKYENDLIGNPIEIKKFEKNRLVSTSTVKYEFDISGNWINRTESTVIPENIYGEPEQTTSEITIREIEYYLHSTK